MKMPWFHEQIVVQRVSETTKRFHESNVIICILYMARPKRVFPTIKRTRRDVVLATGIKWNINNNNSNDDDLDRNVWNYYYCYYEINKKVLWTIVERSATSLYVWMWIHETDAHLKSIQLKQQTIVFKLK